MYNTGKVRLEAAQIAAIEDTLNKGDRVEIIPIKDGVKILKVERKEIPVRKRSGGRVESD